jgi:hypothetical protein
MRWASGLESHPDLIAYWKFNDPDNDNGQFKTHIVRCRGAAAGWAVLGCAGWAAHPARLLRWPRPARYQARGRGRRENPRVGAGTHPVGRRRAREVGGRRRLQPPTPPPIALVTSPPPPPPTFIPPPHSPPGPGAVAGREGLLGEGQRSGARGAAHARRRRDRGRRQLAAHRWAPGGEGGKGLEDGTAAAAGRWRGRGGGVGRRAARAATTAGSARRPPRRASVQAAAQGGAALTPRARAPRPAAPRARPAGVQEQPGAEQGHQGHARQELHRGVLGPGHRARQAGPHAGGRGLGAAGGAARREALSAAWG